MQKRRSRKPFQFEYDDLLSVIMNNDRPIVTVVTATYKNFGHLFQTMLSVFKQSYSNIQYIVTDDGSDNFPKAEIEEFIKAHNEKNFEVLVIHHAENVGTVKNLNGAYKQGKGEFFFNLSCGDVFFDINVVESIVNEFLTRNSDVIVTSRILYKGDFEPICFLPHYEERQVIAKWKTGIEQYKSFITGMSYDMASGSAMHFSRRILETIGYFDERYVLWEDGPFLAKYLQNWKLDCIYDIISIWYESGGGSDNRSKSKKPTISVAKQKLLNDTILFDKYERKLRLDLLNRTERRIVELRIKRREYRDSAKRYLLAFLYFPERLICKKYIVSRKKRYKDDIIEIEKVLNDPNRKGSLCKFRL